jgi:hypothetical protein
MSDKHPETAATVIWWDRPLITPRAAAIAIATWIILDLIEITVRHLS